MPAINVRVDKKRYNIDNLREGVVRVGWFSDTKYDDGVSVAQVARWNEFGTPSAKYPIPARPFMRPVTHGKAPQLAEQLRATYQMAIRNNTDTMKVLERFGEYVIALIQRQIDATTSPANSPITIHGGWLRSASGKSFHVAGKKRTHPLIDTGFMRATVSYQAEEIRK